MTSAPHFQNTDLPPPLGKAECHRMVRGWAQMQLRNAIAVKETQAYSQTTLNNKDTTLRFFPEGPRRGQETLGTPWSQDCVLTPPDSWGSLERDLGHYQPLLCHSSPWWWCFSRLTLCKENTQLPTWLCCPRGESRPKGSPHSDGSRITMKGTSCVWPF